MPSSLEYNTVYAYVWAITLITDFHNSQMLLYKFDNSVI